MKKHDLYDKFLTDSLSESEEKELLEVLEDEEKSNSFAEYIIETNMMVSSAELIEGQEYQKRSSRAEIRALIMVAAAMIALGLFLFMKPAQSAYQVVSSTLSSFKAGDKLNSKKINLDEGSLVLKSSAGDTLKLLGPTSVKLVSAKMISVDKGRVSVKLADETEEFTAVTPHGLVKDMGTAFGLIVEDSSTELHVFEGKVLVELPAYSQFLLAGNALSFTSVGKTADIKFKEDIFDTQDKGSLFIGDRQLRPGEQMDLVLDSSGQVLTADLKLEYKEEKKFRYQIIAHANGEKVFQSQKFNAGDKAKIRIPAADTKDLKIEMKVLGGYAANSILKLENLSLETKGVRPYEGETLISANSEWQYIFESKPEKNWMTNNFDASNWHTGDAVLGFGDKDISTKIGPNELKKTVKQIYFRHVFEVNDLEINSLKRIVANLLADDGALIYLNGQEIIRYNLPQGPLSDETHALKVISSGGEMIYQNFSVPSSSLRMGKNIISVILFQRKGRSSDMRFDLQLKVF